MSSILAADFGSIYTRLIMLDLVDGSYRLVAQSTARTTAGFPYHDVSVGLAHGLEDISYITGRTLVDDEGRVITPEQPDRSGVSHFVATASAGRPLRTILIGLVPELSIASGLRATAGTYVEIVDTFSLNDTRNDEEKLNAIVSRNPDLVFITGGAEFGAREPVLAMLDMLHLALNLVDQSRRPVVLYAGNSALTPEIRAKFAHLTSLFIAPNVRPSPEVEDLDGAQLQLGLAYNAFKENRGTGFQTVAEMTSLGVLPTAQGYNLMVEYLGQALDQNALAVDVGSAVSSLSAFVNGDVHTTIRTDIGQGNSAVQSLETLGIEPISRWLPFYTTEAELQEYAYNKQLRPASIPETTRELYLEHAFLRAAIEGLVAASQPVWQQNLMAGTTLPTFEPIIGAGAALTQTGSGGLTAMLLLDTLQPEGITTLRADPFGLMPAMGALAFFKPEAVVQVMERTGLESLGTTISLSGIPRVDRPALEVKITTPDDTVQQRIDGGHIWIYNLPVGQTADVQLRVMGRGVSIGGKRRLNVKLTGGTAGLVFDMRGRPLPLLEDVAGRADQMTQWFAEVTGTLPFNVPSSWLEMREVALKATASPSRPVRDLKEPKATTSASDDEDDFLDLDYVDEPEKTTDDIRNALS